MVMPGLLEGGLKNAAPQLAQLLQGGVEDRAGRRTGRETAPVHPGRDRKPGSGSRRPGHTAPSTA